MNKTRLTKKKSHPRLGSKPRLRGPPHVRRTSIAIFTTFSKNGIGGFLRSHSAPQQAISQIEELEPTLDPLHQTLTRTVFDRVLTQKTYSDLIRVSHIIEMEFNKPNRPKQTIDPGLAFSEEDYPDKHSRQMKQMIHVVKILIQFFFHMHKRYGKTSDQENFRGIVCKALDDYTLSYENGEFDSTEYNLHGAFQLLKESFVLTDELCDDDTELMSEVLRSVERVLAFLHVSVIVHGIEEMRDKLSLGMDHLTKDIHDNGWRIHIRLDDRVVEISHTRREAVLKQKGSGDKNYWEIEYNLTSVFGPLMGEFNAVRLSVTGLKFGEDVDQEIREEIESKFFNGNFIIC